MWTNREWISSTNFIDLYTKQFRSLGNKVAPQLYLSLQVIVVEHCTSYSSASRFDYIEVSEASLPGNRGWTGRMRSACLWQAWSFWGSQIGKERELQVVSVVYSRRQDSLRLLTNILVSLRGQLKGTLQIEAVALPSLSWRQHKILTISSTEMWEEKRLYRLLHMICTIREISFA